MLLDRRRAPALLDVRRRSVTVAQARGLLVELERRFPDPVMRAKAILLTMDLASRPGGVTLAELDAAIVELERGATPGAAS
jgi:hypothetical protein